MNKKKIDIWKCGFIVLLLACMGTSAVLVWNQLHFPDIYISDLYIHFDSMIANKKKIGYSLLSALTELFYAISGENKEITKFLWTIILSLCNGISVLLICYAYKKIYKIVLNKWVYFFSLSSIYVTAFFSRYHRVGFANTWHNSTTTMLRPLSIGVVVFTCLVYKNHAEGKPIKKYLILNAITTFFAMWAKPSFLLVFLPAMGVLFLTELIQQKGKNIAFLLKLGGSYLTGIPVLIFQYSKLYTPVGGEIGESSYIYLVTKWTSEHVLNVLYAMCCSSVFIVPGLLLLFRYRRTNTKALLVAWVSYFVAYFYRYFLNEGGPRNTHGNFNWSVVNMLFLLTAFVAGEVFIKPSDKKIPLFWKVALGGIYACILFSGLFYFWVMYNGGSYL